MLLRAPQNPGQFGIILIYCLLYIFLLHVLKEEAKGPFYQKIWFLF